MELCSEGASMLPLMLSSEEGWKDAVFFQYPRQSFIEHIPECMGYSIRYIMYVRYSIMGYSIRTSQWRYTEWVRIDR